MSNRDSAVGVMRLGELRLLGFRLPSELDDVSDGEVLFLTREGALTWVAKILANWEVDEKLGQRLMEGWSDSALGDVIATWLLMRVVFKSEHHVQFLHTKNRKFEGLSLWESIESGGHHEVRGYLASQVFTGSW